MKPGEFLSTYREIDQVGQLEHWLSGSPDQHPGAGTPSKATNHVLQLTGLSGSSPAMVTACALREPAKTMVIVLPDKDTAAYFRNDLLNFLTPPDKTENSDKKNTSVKINPPEILFFPS